MRARPPQERARDQLGAAGGRPCLRPRILTPTRQSRCCEARGRHCSLTHDRDRFERAVNSFGGARGGSARPGLGFGAPVCRGQFSERRARCSRRTRARTTTPTTKARAVVGITRLGEAGGGAQRRRRGMPFAPISASAKATDMTADTDTDTDTTTTNSSLRRARDQFSEWGCARRAHTPRLGIQLKRSLKS